MLSDIEHAKAGHFSMNRRRLPRKNVFSMSDVTLDHLNVIEVASPSKCHLIHAAYGLFSPTGNVEDTVSQGNAIHFMLMKNLGPHATVRKGFFL